MSATDEGAPSLEIPRYGPADAISAPRYVGVRTFARCPHVTDPEAVDVAIVGVPFDTATSFRTGARFGPEHIRSASTLLRPYHPELDVDVFAAQSVVDFGDLAITPGNAERTAAQIAAGLQPLVNAGVTPIVLGGDHSIVLGELRAYAAACGPLGVMLLDAHADTWDNYYGERFFHGTPFRRALEEGLIDPARSLFAGLRGPLYAPQDLEAPREMGFNVLTGSELASMTAEAFGEQARSVIGDGPAYFSFDIDVIDPAFAPATGTPEVCGLLPIQALGFVRALAGVPFVGYDIVEVSPQYDGPAQQTSLLAANVGYDFLALNALKRRA